jgi:hypothetical protein
MNVTPKVFRTVALACLAVAATYGQLLALTLLCR